jgi:hypothetical protein
MNVETIGVGDNSIGARIVILVSFDMFLGDVKRKRLQDLEGLVGDVKVSL